jgi:hypothetical protein
MPAAVAALTLAVLLGAAAPAGAATLRAGVGRADITPPTGYFMMGWVRSDAQITGQHTRLWARVIVLEQDGKKIALVSEDLNGIPGGMLADAADMVRDRGFSEQNVLDSASHTHAAPTSYYNFGTYNTVFPSTGTPTTFNTAADPQLYAFMVRQLARAIARADDDLARAQIGWGKTDLLGLTQNRSIEAHLADHGLLVDFGSGSAAMDPLGYAHTIDPEVHVLRVDKIARGGRHVPVGVWSTFADHGTVNKYTFHYYNRDHHGSATQVVEDALRAAGKPKPKPKARKRKRHRRGTRHSAPYAGKALVPAAAKPKQEVVNVYGNTDEGDQSAGLDRSGPAASDYVGRVEARKMLEAWRAARKNMRSSLPIEGRWTRVCFCGQDTDEGPVDSKAVVGLPLLTGSEEGRGPLFDVTHEPFEGRTNPVAVGPQGHKLQVESDVQGGTPRAVPLLALKIGDRMIVSIPGEMTAEMGRRVREAVLGAAASGGVSHVVISGLANEYLSYFTTPEEYDRQHYEGGSTLYGRTSSELLKLTLVNLAKAITDGKPAAEPYAFDPRNGLQGDPTPFDQGAGDATALEQPERTARLARAAFSWQGGPKGFDRPLERAFVTVQRRVGKRWKAFDSDLGLATLWSVDANGAYRAEWEAPLSAPAGSYRFRITGNRYTIVSRPFAVVATRALSLAAADAGSGRIGVKLAYPQPVPEQDLTYRPAGAGRGSVAFSVAGKRVVAKKSRSGVFSVKVPAGGTVSVAAGAARDRYGNRNGEPLTLRP